MQKKIGIVTWITYHNFGTFLQAYALQRVVSSLGYENKILSDQRLVLEIHPKAGLFRRFLITCYHCFFDFKGLWKGFSKASESYHSFEQKYLQVDHSWKDESELNKRYDTFICGSDQIWSPVIPFQPYYYLAFTRKKKIAYAPSIGQDFYPEDRKSQMKELLSDFTAVSVREKRGAELLRSFINKPIETVVDPTLLVSSDLWYPLVEQGKTESPYVLCYLLTFNEHYLRYVKQFAEKKCLPLKIFILDKRYLSFADEPIYAGPKEFLYQIFHSSYFFTDSFHGTIFAIHFKKWFRVFKRFKSGAANNQNSRVENLLSIAGLQDYFIDESEFDKIEQLPSIVYTEVKESIHKERERSLLFLNKALMSQS